METLRTLVSPSADTSTASQADWNTAQFPFSHVGTALWKLILHGFFPCSSSSLTRTSSNS